MKILIIAGFAESLVRFRIDLISTLIDNGNEVCVACPNIDSLTEATLTEKGVNIYQVPLKRAGMNPLQDIGYLCGLIRLMRAISPDAVLAYTIKPVIYGLLASGFTNVKKRFALITGLGYAFTGPATGARSMIRKVVRLLYRYALLRASVIFFQNPDDEALFKQLGITSDLAKTRIVNGSGVNTMAYSVVPVPNNKVFLLIARLLGDKGVREYAAAAAIVKKKHPDARFDLAGWIDENPDAIKKQELDAWVQSGHINFLGKLADVRPAIAKCAIYVLPSYREGTPRTVLEAMAMGRAIITSDAPGCREAVVHRVNGLLVPVKSIKELADGMLTLIENQNLLIEYGQNSRRIAEDKYDVHKVNAFMLEEMGFVQ